jgi:uncharacterized membrane protein YkoI
MNAVWLLIVATLTALTVTQAVDVVGARLCEQGGALVYVLTVLGHDGRVARETVDAVNGALVGER